MDYKKHYISLMNKAKSRYLDEGTYSESHHIIPDSEGGPDEDWNLVDLTAREHYLAHYLLWMESKVHNLPSKESRARAFWFMCQDIERRKHTVPSRVYEAARIAVSEANKTGKVVECEICGKSFYRQKHAIRSKVFCSRECFGNSAKPQQERTGWSRESREKASKRRTGKITINNGQVNKFISSTELQQYLSEGWLKGPKSREKMRWWNNGTQEAYVPVSKEVPKGWVRGRLGISNTKGKKAISKNGEVKFVNNPDDWIKEGWTLGNEKYYPGYLHQERNKKRDGH